MLNAWRYAHEKIVGLMHGMGAPNAFVLHAAVWWWVGMAPAVVFLLLFSLLCDASNKMGMTSWDMRYSLLAAEVCAHVIVSQFVCVFCGLMAISSVRYFQNEKAKFQVLGQDKLAKHAIERQRFLLGVSIFFAVFLLTMVFPVNIMDESSPEWAYTMVSIIVFLCPLVLVGFLVFRVAEKFLGRGLKLFGLRRFVILVEDRFGDLPKSVRLESIGRAVHLGLDPTSPSVMRAALATHKQERKKALEQARLLDEETTPSQAARPVGRL